MRPDRPRLPTDVLPQGRGTLAVLGAGTMGAQIAVTAAAAGHPVLLWHRRLAATVLEGLGRWVRRLARTRRMTSAQSHTVAQRIQLVSTLEPLATVEVIIEAVVEDLDIKQYVLHQAEHVAVSAQLIASCTSSLSIESLGERMARPELLVGVHFLNPVMDIPLVEVAATAHTSPAAIETAVQLLTGMDKTPFFVENQPGFVVNRVLMPLLNEAAWLVHQGTASEDVDRAMQLGARLPMGPLSLADLIGLDVCLRILQSLAQQVHGRFQPCPLWEQLVQQGRLGRKSGYGFFRYGRTTAHAHPSPVLA